MTPEQKWKEFEKRTLKRKIAKKEEYDQQRKTTAK
jgi:hypothetical protein